MIEIRIGDALDQLREMPDESVHCCVTSPPYWGLRDYGVDGQIGLEETPDEWCARLVEVFREVKRVLRKDGTCWVNVGDSYASNGTGTHRAEREFHNTKGGTSACAAWSSREQATARTAIGGIKPKDLIGQPWLLAFALRADGWFLRDAIVWNKPNPMPESVRDRCTNAYEHVFLLSKRARYFFDAEAIKEQNSPGAIDRFSKNNSISIANRQAAGLDGENRGAAATRMPKWQNNSRNCRNVWTIATEAFSEAHFATFPTELARRCILAGTSSKGVCAECGAPWDREMTPASGGTIGKSWHGHEDDNGRGNAVPIDLGSQGYQRPKSIGWQPSCKCDADIAQATVLDPFAGIGGFSLGLERAGMRTIAFCEIDPFCRDVLSKHWPDVPCHDDITEMRGLDVGPVDVVCGGFPCQDISIAGKGEGLEGKRSGLFYEFARLIGEIRPRYAIMENVPALRSRGLSDVLRELAALRYDAEWHCIPATTLCTPHTRDRIWIVAQTTSPRTDRIGSSVCESQGKERIVAHPQSDRRETEGQRPSSGYIDWSGQLRLEPQAHWDIEPAIPRVANGVPARLHRLRSIGNAVVPQMAELIGHALIAARRVA